MKLEIKDAHTLVEKTTFFKITGLNFNQPHPEGMFDEIDKFLKEKGADRFWLSNNDIQINFEHSTCLSSAEELTEGITNIVNKYHKEAAA